ncbi:hypothetical protein glysoja_017217 [Glycine soja]|nr:hypothetical protein glysoja_017217 [Glycine soja]
MENNEPPRRLEGKYAAMVVCWLLGNGCLFAWNSMLTIEDYYVHLFPKYHPSRVLTLVYQPFAVGTLAILAYKEDRINTRIRNLFGYTLFFISTLSILILDLATSGKGGLGTFVGTCVISGAFGIADAHTQGGMVGDLSYMLPEFIQSFLAGLAASGVLTSALRLITKAAFEKTKNGLRKGAKDTGSHSLGTWYALVLIAMYNVCDLIGRYIPLLKFLKVESRKKLTTAIVSRLLFVPAFYFTAKYGTQGWMIMLTCFLGLSNGYFTVCVLTSAPKGYKGPEQNALGNLLVLFLLGGIFAGVALDWLWLIGKGW